MITIITGDGPAIADTIGFKRPGNAYRPCRFCKIKGTMGDAVGQRQTGTYYVPHIDYDFACPELRGDNQQQREIIATVVEANSPSHNMKSGINRASILMELRSINFTRSFPIDLMHCVLLNITETLFKLWNRTKLSFEQEAQPVPGCHFFKPSIDAISESLATARGNIPSSLCRAPRRIDKHYMGYKAAEWEAWLRYYGTPLLDQHLGDEYVENFRQLSRIYSLATQRSIGQTQLSELEDLCVDFVKNYEKLYYRGESRRLPVCSVNVHYLLHLPSNVRDCGPSCYSSQFTMERYCGIVKPMARSKSQLNTSLTNGVINTEHFHHVRFTREINLQSPRSYPVLLNPFTTSHRRQAHLRRTLLEYLRCDIIDIKVYKRCQVNEELIAGSTYSQRRADINRNNNRICYSYVMNQKKIIGLGTVDLFAMAISHQAHYCLALVRDYTGIDKDCTKRVVSFVGEGSYRWIKISSINSLFGILREGGINFVITNIDLFD